MQDAETRIPDLKEQTYHPIEDYGVIGDLRTAALVGPNGSIDMLCWPRFDSPSIFCALVDHRKGGRFQIVPLLANARQLRLYLPDTNILLSRFLSDDGVAEVSDFMLLTDAAASPQALVRRAKCVRGEIRFRVTCAPRFDYARADHRIERQGNAVVFVSDGADGTAVRLRSSVPLQVDDGAAVGEFRLRTGETASFVLESPGPAEACCDPDRGECARAFKQTSDYWRRWVHRSKYTGRWREMVNRSALALKLLTSREFGSIVASPCFGLPAEIGGERNWDYRFTWIRDAAFTLYALIRLGFMDEAEAFLTWLADRCQQIDDGGSLQIMYGIDGRADVDEITLDHLAGYMGSRPVRIGSTNYDQVQLDIYGELLDAVYLYDKFGAPISHDMWAQIVRLLGWLCDHWRQPDAGMWEVRGGNREFLSSRFMCWVALDRGLRMAAKRSRPAPVEAWRRERDRIYTSIFDEFWSPSRKAFVQSRGSNALDASALLMPLIKIVSPTDPRWLSTLRAIHDDLVCDSLVYRYHVGEAFSDELAGRDGTFSICSFWYIECVSRAGDPQQARYLFEKMLGYGNSLGLFSEQLGRRGEFLGNIPQAFTHLALISAAFDLDRRLSERGLD